MDREEKVESQDVSRAQGVREIPAQQGGQLRSLAATLMEWILTVIAVLAFFLFLIWGSTLVLPQGTSLISLDNGATEDKGGARRDAGVSSGGEVSILASGNRVAAILSELHNTVKHRPADKISWADALSGMRLYNQDAVKTNNASHAVISFDDTNQLRLGPDSLVIVKSLEDNPWFSERRPALVMMEGELRGNMLANLSQTPSNVEVIIPGGVARINQEKDLSGEVEYEIKVNQDQSASVVVYRGSAEVEAQDIKVEVGANQITRVVKGAAPTKPASIQEGAKLIGPAHEAETYYRDFPKEITFSWKETEERRYRLEIARDALFEAKVVNEIIAGSEFIHGDLHQGEYYWRVASVLDDGGEGRLSQTRRLTVVQDLQPPFLRVNHPPGMISSPTYRLSGSVEPGSTLIINDIEVEADEGGAFEVEVKLKRGVNIIAAQAVDRAGNATFVSERVTREFKAQ